MEEPQITERDEQPKLGQSKVWLARIKAAEKAFNTYQEKCDSIDKLYASLEKHASTQGDREFKIFWANMEVLKPTIYERPPRPVVMPRHSDADELQRVASEVVERALEMDVEQDDLHDTLIMVRDDLALSARGVAWVLDNGNAIHVDRKDFLHEPARNWREVGWVSRRAYMTREEGLKRFGDVFKSAKRERVETEDQKDYESSDRKAQVWEIWSRTENKVVWVTEGVETTLDEQPPLINVKGFYPCPKPAYGTVERSTLKPVPDYVYYRDQADEINELTARISSLSESLRMRGFYASGVSEVGEAIEAAMKMTDNNSVLIPVSNLAALGGSALKDSIVWLPVREVAEVIAQLIDLRRQLIEDVYEITGLSDIMRGTSEASETLGAQQLKAQYGNVRVRGRQGEMVRIARDILRIKGEVFAEQFEIGELLEMAGKQLPTMQDLMQMEIQYRQAVVMAAQAGQQPPEMPDLQNMVTAEKVDVLLKNERLRPFLLEIESDSTIAPDEQAEKESRMEFIAAVGGFITQATPMVAALPETAPFAAEMLKFAAGGFRAGRDLKGAIDEFAKQLTAKAQPQGPTPEQVAVQQEAQAKQREMDLKVQSLQQAMQNDARKFQLDEAKLRMDVGIKAQEMGLKVGDQELARTQQEIDALFKAEELEIERNQRRPAAIGET